MRDRTAFVVVLGLFAAWTCEARAQPISVIGVGARDCGQYLQAAENERKSRPPAPDPDGFYTIEYLAYVEWLEGFLSGYNTGDSADRFVGHSATRAAKMAFVENWCRQNPLAGFLGAANALRAELKKREVDLPHSGLPHGGAEVRNSNITGKLSAEERGAIETRFGNAGLRTRTPLISKRCR